MAVRWYPYVAVCVAALVCACSHCSPQAIRFVGVGYNLLRGNPDGGIASRGGIDPGLLPTRRIFELSAGDVPREIVYQPRQSCAQVQTTSIFYGTKSYQKKLSFGLKASGGANVALASFAFSLSPGYNSAHEKTNKERQVFQDDQKVCNLGRARFAEELAHSDKFSVARGFAAAICALSDTYNQSEYMDFINHWGTHVTMQVELGTKSVKRYKSSLSQFVEHVMKNSKVDLSLGGSYMGYGASIGVNYTNFKNSASYKLNFGQYQYTLTSGSEKLPEPIGVKVVTIDTALDSKYWQRHDEFLRDGICSSNSLSKLGALRFSLVQALTEYPAYMMAPQATDQLLVIPVTWPSGSYGLMKPITGCPTGNFTWYEGSRLQDTDDTFDFGQKVTAPNLHLFDYYSPYFVQQWFCIKGQRTVSEFDVSWPSGDYCILKYGDCPSGFDSGYIKWDDDDFRNFNNKSGILPDGEYDDDTKIYYCCRNDGLPTEAVILPTDQPFYLIRYTRACQHVTNMHVTEEVLHFDDEDIFNDDDESSVHPYNDGRGSNINLHLCYYEPPVNVPLIG